MYTVINDFFVVKIVVKRKYHFLGKATQISQEWDNKVVKIKWYILYISDVQANEQSYKDRWNIQNQHTKIKQHTKRKTLLKHNTQLFCQKYENGWKPEMLTNVNNNTFMSFIVFLKMECVGCKKKIPLWTKIIWAYLQVWNQPIQLHTDRCVIIKYSIILVELYQQLCENLSPMNIEYFMCVQLAKAMKQECSQDLKL